jgi:simple sugar transport system ATP-binding protein
MVGITKKFPGVIANNKVNFSLRAGEVHGLLGENGAGKTTLMNILYGLYDADDGIIQLKGKPVTINNSNDAIHLGLGMVHQHFQFVPRFTVAENFLLGVSSPREPLLEELSKVNKKIREFSSKYQLPVDPSRKMWQLSVGEQQRVEILRALYRGAEILILDEPTSVLTPQEVKQLAIILENLISAGKSVIFISHKLEEVMMMTHQVTVMRDGKVIGSLKTKDTTRAKLARMMVGRDIPSITNRGHSDSRSKPVLQINNLSIKDDRSLEAVRNVSLEVYSGEIIGIAGVEGNGQVELEESIVGIRQISSGKITLNHTDITNAPVQNRRKNLAYIPSNRYLRGVIGKFSVAENSVLGKHERRPFSFSGYLSINNILENAKDLVEEYQIKTPNIQTKVGKLSGGNAQRLILARELSAQPDVILACQPTRGLDVGATQYVHEKLLEQRNAGAGILLISADLEEIMKLCDRIAVIFEGKIMQILDREDAEVETLGLLMAGSQVS